MKNVQKDHHVIKVLVVEPFQLMSIKNYVINRRLRPIRLVDLRISLCIIGLPSVAKVFQRNFMCFNNIRMPWIRELIDRLIPDGH